MNFFFICFLALPLAITNYVACGKNSQYSLRKEYRRFNIFDEYKYFLLQAENHKNIGKNLKAKAERDEQEKKNKQENQPTFAAIDTPLALKARRGSSSSRRRET